MKEQFMDLNRETAMRLWGKAFGKETKVKDFAGREIAKGAYNDRNSEFGWNVDHILPQSKGGKTADYNLVCCHILTNDEKADKFPCFSANSIKFEIVKVENHYEIKRVDKKNKKQSESDDSVNFYDSASGIRFFKELKGKQNKPVFVGSVLIKLQNVRNTAIVDFVKKIFDTESISYPSNQNNEIQIIARNYNMPLMADSAVLLDKCILLNTYLGYYFKPMQYISGYEIYYRDDDFQDKRSMFTESQKIDFKNIGGFNGLLFNLGTRDSLFINNRVIENTDAKEKISVNQYSEYSEYNYIFTNLSKNLEKEVNKG